jgi:hypothetical protein
MAKCMHFLSDVTAPDGSRFDRPLLVLDHKNNVVQNNTREFHAWRKRTDPVAYKAAMEGLMSVLVESVVREIMLEAQIGQPGFVFFWACRERGRSRR